ncbi:MAG: hypothetical protein U0X40_05300 [Ferruginibacter sp.]
MKTLSLLLSLWIMLAVCTKMTGFQPSPTQITDSLPRCLLMIVSSRRITMNW